MLLSSTEHTVSMLVSVYTYIQHVYALALQHNNPTLYTVAIRIVDGDITPTAGQSYSLTCSVSADGFEPSYQWKKGDEVLQNKTANVLSLSPLKFADTGLYICEVTVRGVKFTKRKNVVVQSK